MPKQWPYPRLIAHCGGGCLAPENTLAAMRCGANYGFDMVEFDVKLSKDNILILLHDDDVQRTSNRQGLVAEAVSAWFKNTSTPPLISSFSIASLEAFQKVAPEFALALLCDEYTPVIKKAAKKLDCIAVNPDQSNLTEKLIKTIHKDAYKICAWTVNDYLRAKELLQWGCDAIFTDELERIPASMA